MKYNTLKLPCGLRIIHLPSASPVAYCGYQLAAGTRHELPGEEGLAHFCEHTTFKGTERRSALEVINALEGVGGELNAFTTKESTVYYAAVLTTHFDEAVDLLTDMVFHSTYPQAEIEREVEVVCDEIESYNDSPAELIYDEFENLVFKGHPLGHNILGKAEQLRTYTTDHLRRFARRNYRPDNAVFFVYGNLAFDEIVKSVSSSLGFRVESLEFATATPSPSIDPEGTAAANSSLFTLHSSLSTPIVRHLGTHQAHVMMGCRTFPFNDERRMPLYLLNNVLGGPAMNARLNLVLREEHGLVYTVESTTVHYSDTGCWNVYFGCAPADIDKCCQLVQEQLNLAMQQPMTPQQLMAAKQQIKGQLAIACDNREQFALDFGKSYLHDGRERHLEELMKRIDAITADDILSVARQLFDPATLTVLIFK